MVGSDGIAVSGAGIDNRRFHARASRWLPSECCMNLSLRALCALLIVAMAAGAASAQDPALASERDRVGYLVGMDTARSLGPR